MCARQEPTSRSLPPPYKPYESTSARIFLFLERHELFGFARTVQNGQSEQSYCQAKTKMAKTMYAKH